MGICAVPPTRVWGARTSPHGTPAAPGSRLVRDAASHLASVRGTVRGMAAFLLSLGRDHSRPRRQNRHDPDVHGARRSVETEARHAVRTSVSLSQGVAGVGAPAARTRRDGYGAGRRHGPLAARRRRRALVFSCTSKAALRPFGGSDQAAADTARLGVVPDFLSPETRSRVMARNRSKNTKPELALRQALHAAGVRASPTARPRRPTSRRAARRSLRPRSARYSASPHCSACGAVVCHRSGRAPGRHPGACLVLCAGRSPRRAARGARRRGDAQPRPRSVDRRPLLTARARFRFVTWSSLGTGLSRPGCLPTGARHGVRHRTAGGGGDGRDPRSASRLAGTPLGRAGSTRPRCPSRSLP